MIADSAAVLLRAVRAPARRLGARALLAGLRPLRRAVRDAARRPRRRRTPAFRAWWDETLAATTMHLTDEARYMGRAVAFEIPMPAVNQGAKRVHDLIMLGRLPPRVRELYGLAWTGAGARLPRRPSRCSRLAAARGAARADARLERAQLRARAGDASGRGSTPAGRRRSCRRWRRGAGRRRRARAGERARRRTGRRDRLTRSRPRRARRRATASATVVVGVRLPAPPRRARAGRRAGARRASRRGRANGARASAVASQQSSTSA